ncbi:hypothetical protein BQ8794_10141 [Mesorhizobium prunaredense]|uniref:Uncharacterized protein n=1 Tax=Mesorhizobium prunaredense TaxID=1631249 RepID=A0A1R3UYQ7_9HYPH|nr:hypothetical protein BQ8794_10141 [Mesorhizobium prunaredense]
MVSDCLAVPVILESAHYWRRARWPLASSAGPARESADVGLGRAKISRYSLRNLMPAQVRKATIPRVHAGLPLATLSGLTTPVPSVRL